MCTVEIRPLSPPCVECVISSLKRGLGEGEMKFHIMEDQYPHSIYLSIMLTSYLGVNVA